MLRVRFKANPDDCRPVKWPVKHPYWCSGYGDDYIILISYADSIDQIKELWPEAQDIEVMETCDCYTFSRRFPRPQWFVLEGVMK